MIEIVCSLGMFAETTSMHSFPIEKAAQAPVHHLPTRIPCLTGNPDTLDKNRCVDFTRRLHQRWSQILRRGRIWQHAFSTRSRSLLSSKWSVCVHPFRKSKIVYKAKGRIARQVTWLSARACSSASLPNASAPPHWLLYRRWISVVLLKALWLVEVWGHNNLQVPQMDWGSPLVTPNEGASCPLFFDLSVHGIK